MTTAADLMIANIALPRGTQLLGYIDRHPSDDGGLGYAVIETDAGIEIAWNGHNFRSLPRNWRDLVEFSTAAVSSQ
jgi:hypothetical protein